MAPEVMNSEEFDKSLDVYSFAYILWELWIGDEPFSEFEDYDEFFEAVVVLHKRPDLPTDSPSSLNALLQACWHRNRRERPTFSRVVDILSEIKVDVEIQDPHVASWWKKAFLDPTEVTWKEFNKAIPSNAPVSPVRSLVVTGNLVSPTLFQHSIELLGPYYIQEHASSILSQFKEATEKSWYYGTDSRTTVENLLMKNDVGTYLVRISLSEWKFVLSYRKDALNVAHRKIHPNEKMGSLAIQLWMGKSKNKPCQN